MYVEVFVEVWVIQEGVVATYVNCFLKCSFCLSCPTEWTFAFAFHHLIHWGKDVPSFFQCIFIKNDHTQESPELSYILGFVMFLLLALSAVVEIFLAC